MTKADLKAIARILRTLIRNPYHPADGSIEKNLIALIKEMGYKHLLKQEQGE
ncbi:MAG: hypothetical protein ABL876_19120 [Chitinophagaceae bacterium]